MNFALLRRGRMAAALAVSAGAIALAGLLPASAATAAPARPVGHDWVHAIVLVNCQHRGVVVPTKFVLTCADANDFLTSLRWVSWRDVAYGSGWEEINSCVPSCVAGHFKSYHVLITVWRQVPRGHHTGQLKFTRITLIYPAARPARFTRHGHKHYPLTWTWHV